MAVFDDTAADKLVLFRTASSGTPRRSAGGDRVVVPLEPPSRCRECAHFLTCAAERRPPSTDGAEGCA